MMIKQTKALHWVDKAKDTYYSCQLALQWYPFLDIYNKTLCYVVESSHDSSNIISIK